jgi:flagellar hook-associated protein 2
MAEISFSGISSGFETDGIIQKMLSIEKRRIKWAEDDRAIARATIDLNNKVSSFLQNISSAAAALHTNKSYQSLSSNSSNPAMIAISSVEDTANQGQYDIVATQLAKAHKISSNVQVDPTAALNLSGTVVINGIAVNVKSSDSLNSIAANINSAGIDVIASVYGSGTTNYLTITSQKTGTENAIQISDLSGSTASSLGFIGGSVTMNTTENASRMRGYRIKDHNDKLCNQMRLKDWTQQNQYFTLNGQSINVDLNSDSLRDIADRINANPIYGATATIVKSGSERRSSYTIEIENVSGGSLPSVQDPCNILKALGFSQETYLNPIVAAQDANFTIDGKSFLNADNSVENVIPGITFQLLQAKNTTTNISGESVISVSYDTGGVVNKIRSLKDAYNAAMDFFEANSQFDKDTFQSGPLAGNELVQSFQNSATQLLFESPIGATGAYSNLTQIGFGMQDGKLTLDESVLTSAILSDYNSVQRLFVSRGSASNSDISYVSSNLQTQSSANGAVGYPVSITQVPTYASLMASSSPTQTNTAGEILTFSGSLFGGSNYQLSITSGNSLQNTINQINSDAYLGPLVNATNSGGKLQLTSSKYGQAGNFSVVSNLAAASNTTGIGLSGSSQLTSGLDVGGTIDGNAAKGFGQYMLVDSNYIKSLASDPKSVGVIQSDGLQLKYTGSSVGNVGNITFSKGIAGDFMGLIQNYTDSVSGYLPAENKSKEANVKQISEDIIRHNEEMKRKEQQLREQFLEMERAISRSQEQAQQLSSMFPAKSMMGGADAKKAMAF